MDNKSEVLEFAELYDRYQKDKAEKAVAANNTAQLMHGPTGLFSTAGLEPDVISTILQPRGLAAILPKVATRYTNPQFPALTGQEADVGDEPDDSCGDPVRAGAKKSCILTAQFGMLQRGTDTIDPSEIITLINRGEFTDLRLIGALLENDTGLAPGNLNDKNAVLNNVIYSQMNGVGISMERALSTQLWQGVVAGATNGYAQFPGLDVQIATGQVDAVNNVACPALDSDVKDFAYDEVGGTGRDIVEYMSMLEYYIYHIAERTRMLPVEWVWVMRPELWRELSQVWPISYNTFHSSVLAARTDSRLMLDAKSMVDERDKMRAGKTLEVNGRVYRVVTDDGIYEYNNINNANLEAGEFASNIYFVPIRAAGLPVTRMEYLDYRQIFEFLGQSGELAGKVMFWSDDGQFLWVYRDLPGYCFDLVARTQQRVVLQTSQLAGRIDHVMYSPLQHLRQPDPSGPYHFDGGVSTQDTPATSYAVWK